MGGRLTDCSQLREQSERVQMGEMGASYGVGNQRIELNAGHPNGWLDLSKRDERTKGGHIPSAREEKGGRRAPTEALTRRMVRYDGYRAGQQI